MSIQEAPTIGWRTYRKLDSQRAAVYNAAHFNPDGVRTHKEETILYDVVAHDRKRTARVRNANIAEGKFHTSGGERARGRRT
jgi:hypothetical protein